ncbi:hypothetical protein B0H10DRAFT_2189075 [Mycena sp. CBHHK59/15]|nr:hypothetical protein B0H10DRAFT_2189075 [Mycena sp. CBHHK59/15]
MLLHDHSTSAPLVPSPSTRGRAQRPVHWCPDRCAEHLHKHSTFSANVPGFNPMCRAFGAMYRAWNVPTDPLSKVSGHFTARKQFLDILTADDNHAHVLPALPLPDGELDLSVAASNDPGSFDRMAVLPPAGEFEDLQVEEGEFNPTPPLPPIIFHNITPTIQARIPYPPSTAPSAPPPVQMNPLGSGLPSTLRDVVLYVARTTARNGLCVRGRAGTDFVDVRMRS